MRVLIVSPVYPPETGAAALRVREMAEKLLRAGDSVTVLAGIPSYPAGVVLPGYRRRPLAVRFHEGVRVIRCRQFVRPRGSFLLQLLSEFSLAASTAFFGMFLPRQDVVIASSPPFFIAAAGWLLSRAKRAAFVFDVRDIYPDPLVELGFVSNPILVRLLRSLERFLYNSAALVLSVSNTQAEKIRSRTANPQKVRLVPNGVNVEFFRKRPAASHPVWKKHALDGRFVAVYAGRIGRAHALHTLVRAAELLARDPRVAVLILGDGAEKQKLQKLAAELRLKNVFFESERPADEIPHVLSLAGAGICSRAAGEYSRDALPAKMFEYMACELPVVMAAECEGGRLLREADAGIVVPPEDPRQLAEAILALAADPAEAARLGANGRRFVSAHYTRDKIFAAMREVLLQTADPKSRRSGARRTVPDA
ncbi:MAG: glycosyltransferase family 4 protein [bacterium]